TSYLADIFFHDTSTPDISPLSLHDALPILTADWIGRVSVKPRSRTPSRRRASRPRDVNGIGVVSHGVGARAGPCGATPIPFTSRSEEHTSELQSLAYLVCRLLLEKKNSTSS